ncbi:MAG: uroporphyrinogen-III synthase [Acidobacteria bacterium]|nr:uroporphyrinogen-III synthase [Acidobacteriota bacterium]MYH28543.1 uroporphyrinogen-III synthase [Acidobacteriota bacterium]
MDHEPRPLAGKRILVTRPQAQAPELAERLDALGAESIEAPAIRIVPPDDMQPLDDACAAAASFAWIVFTSANAVDAFLQRLDGPGGGDGKLAGVRICAIGPATAARLARHGLSVDLAPADHRGEGVGAALRAALDLRGTRILLPRADIARPLLPDALRAAGAAVTEVTAYRTVAATAWPGADVRELLDRRRIDAVTFTSASAVRAVAQSLGAVRAVELLRPTVVAAIGPVTARAAGQLGVETTVMPSTYTTQALAQALADYFTGTPAAHFA